MTTRMKLAITNSLNFNLRSRGRLSGKQESSASALRTHGDHQMKTFLGNLSFCTALLVTLFLCQPATSRAQTTSASLSGVVADSTGALIPQASVTLRNTRSHETRHANTSGTGIFQFNAVPAGSYTISVTMKGFETLVTKEIELHPNDTD